MMPGTFTGYASIFNVLDLNGEIVDRGAFVNLPGWLKEGTFAWSHESGLSASEFRPVGYPTAAKQDELGLWVAGSFHSTPDGQAAETWARERKVAGLYVGLSIGYRILGDKHLADGRHLTKLYLYEVSFVGFPANPYAFVTQVKSADPVAHVAAADPNHRHQVEIALARARYLGVEL
jgi:uncharacterized protein